jgi:hypothetical protein
MIRLARLLAAIGRPRSRLLWTWYPSARLWLSIEWKPADLWIGLFVHSRPIDGTDREQVDLYIIVVPTLVVHVAYRLER